MCGIQEIFYAQNNQDCEKSEKFCLEQLGPETITDFHGNEEFSRHYQQQKGQNVKISLSVGYIFNF
jgi:hypothetical protein